MSQTFRTRIVGHDRVDPDSLLANPFNHRTHPRFQRKVVSDLIDDVGFVKSILVNRTTNHVVDGHERVWQAKEAKDNDPNVLIDVEYIEVDLDEEKRILLALDASTALATNDPELLAELVAEAEFESDEVNEMIENLKAGWIPTDFDNVEDYSEEQETVSIRIENVSASDATGIVSEIEAILKDTSYTVKSF